MRPLENLSLQGRERLGRKNKKRSAGISERYRAVTLITVPTSVLKTFSLNERQKQKAKPKSKAQTFFMSRLISSCRCRLASFAAWHNSVYASTLQIPLAALIAVSIGNVV